MATYSITAAGAQDGYSIPGNGFPIPGLNWSESDIFLRAVGTTNYIGLRFQLHSQFDALGRAIEPSLLTVFNLSLTLSSTVFADTTLTLEYVPSSAPAVFSNATAAGERSEESLYDTSDALAQVSLTAATPQDTVVTFTNVSAVPLTPYLRGAGYNGYLCLTISAAGPGAEFHSSRGATASFNPSLTSSNEVSFTTGMIDGDSVGRRSRMRHCPKTGMPVASADLVRDGWFEGTMVSPESYDPRDPEDKYVPNPNEGVLDDEE